MVLPIFDQHHLTVRWRLQLIWYLREVLNRNQLLYIYSHEKQKIVTRPPRKSLVWFFGFFLLEWRLLHNIEVPVDFLDISITTLPEFFQEKNRHLTSPKMTVLFIFYQDTCWASNFCEIVMRHGMWFESKTYDYSQVKNLLKRKPIIDKTRKEIFLTFIFDFWVDSFHISVMTLSQMCNLRSVSDRNHSCIYFREKKLSVDRPESVIALVTFYHDA